MLPYRIETPQLSLRCWSPAHAEAVKRAEDESREHLSRFMIWAAAGPQTLDDVVAKLRFFRMRFDTDADWLYGAFDREGRLVGGCGVHPRVGPGGLEVGYWVHAAHLRRGIATEMAAGLTQAAFLRASTRFVEIRCARSNHASAAIPRRLGFAHEATLPARIEMPGGTFEDALVFTLHRAAYVARGDVACFDGAERRMTA